MSEVKKLNATMEQLEVIADNIVDSIAPRVDARVDELFAEAQARAQEDNEGVVTIQMPMMQDTYNRIIMMAQNRDVTFPTQLTELCEQSLDWHEDAEVVTHSELVDTLGSADILARNIESQVGSLARTLEKAQRMHAEGKRGATRASIAAAKEKCALLTSSLHTPKLNEWRTEHKRHEEARHDQQAVLEAKVDRAREWFHRNGWDRAGVESFLKGLTPDPGRLQKYATDPDPDTVFETALRDTALGLQEILGRHRPDLAKKMGRVVDGLQTMVH